MNEKISIDIIPKRRKKVRHLRKVLGPVQDLEQHVNPDWWGKIFNSLYLKTDGDVVEDQNITRQEVDLFSEILNLSPEDKILDLCCGQGRHSLELTKRGFKYVEGLDRSHYLIQKAKGHAKKEGIDVRFREGDARKLTYQTDTFDIVMILGNSFGYFETLQDDLRVLKEVFRILKPWGKVLIDIADGEYLRENYQPHSWEWMPDPLKPFSIFDDDDFYTIDQLKCALRELRGYTWKYLNNHDTLFDDLKKQKGKVDFVFNLCDEGYNNDARKELHVSSLLETLEIPFTGAGPQCLAYCYDKSLVRGIAKEMGIPIPEAFFIKPEDTIFEIPIGFPLIVKPNFGDSSFGITQKCVTNNLDELLIAISEIREKFGYTKPILVEEFLTGKDLSVGIIGNPPDSYRVLPITEEDYSALPESLPRICGYEAKWLPDSPYWNIKSIPAELPEDTEKIMEEYCLKLWERLECKDYTRFDWRLDANGDPRLLEVNPNPGWCWDGHLAKMAKIAGMSYSELLEAILQGTEQRLGIQILHGNGKNRGL